MTTLSELFEHELILIEMAGAFGHSAIVVQLEANLREEEAALKTLKGLADRVDTYALIAKEAGNEN